LYITTLVPKIKISLITKYALVSVSKITPSFVKNSKLGGNPAILRLKNSKILDSAYDPWEEGLNGDKDTKEIVTKVIIWNKQYRTKKCHIKDSLEIRLITTQDKEYTDEDPTIIVNLVWTIMCITDSKNLITSRVTNPLAPFITIIKRKGIIFCTTLTQTSLMMLIFLIRLINHRWNGAIPNFIMVTRILSIFNSLSKLILKSKIIEPIDWNKKYFTVLLCSWYKSENIKTSKNLNILISIPIQIIIKDLLVIDRTRLPRFNLKANINNHGEIFPYYLSLRRFKFTI